MVLSACSPYFRKLLKANPCEHPIVILRDIRSEDVENLLRCVLHEHRNRESQKKERENFPSSSSWFVAAFGLNGGGKWTLNELINE